VNLDQCDRSVDPVPEQQDTGVVPAWVWNLTWPMVAYSIGHGAIAKSAEECWNEDVH
jgi:hypothetical protein